MFGIAQFGHLGVLGSEGLGGPHPGDNLLLETGYLILLENDFDAFLLEPPYVDPDFVALDYLES